ncbi:hypothetical protein RF11_06536 [Thelohanellus kitauei]|uniref:Uncharacterized protein n=1 Tax=Thelohanellus kitauei TaxID=669202 RepID=A0A0C2MZQ5_THEKT|nr:hypothetical protein RF11_06536 [Thelohanellus kitauei]
MKKVSRAGVESTPHRPSPSGLQLDHSALLRYLRISYILTLLPSLENHALMNPSVHAKCNVKAEPVEMVDKMVFSVHNNHAGLCDNPQFQEYQELMPFGLKNFMDFCNMVEYNFSNNKYVQRLGQN